MNSKYIAFSKIFKLMISFMTILLSLGFCYSRAEAARYLGIAKYESGDFDSEYGVRYVYKNGEKIWNECTVIKRSNKKKIAKLKTPKGEDICYDLDVTKKYIYFLTEKSINQNSVYYLYSYNRNNKKYKKLCMVPKSYYSYETSILFHYNDKLYMSTSGDEGESRFFTYDIKKKTFKTLVKGLGYTNNYSKTLVTLTDFGRMSDIGSNYEDGPTSLYLYDIKKNKKSLIEKNIARDHYIINDWIFYYSHKDGVVRYNPKTKKREVLNFKSYPDLITERYLYYTSYPDGYFRYDYINKEEQALSKSKYEKSVGEGMWLTI